MTVKYDTLPGNQPERYGNKLFIWAGDVVGWTSKPAGKAKVEGNDASGSQLINDVEISRKPYTVGYSVTGKVEGISSSTTFTVPSAGMLMLAAPTSVTLAIVSLTESELVVAYATLRGYKPLSNGNWLGVWRGDHLPWEETPPPLTTALPEDDANEGWATLKTTFRPRSNYTVIYFMADPATQGGNTSAGAILRFDTS